LVVAFLAEAFERGFIKLKPVPSVRLDVMDNFRWLDDAKLQAFLAKWMIF